MTSLFIFRLDFRLKDNIGLINCFKNSKEIIPCFIFDPKQIDPKLNSYFSNNLVQFMIESLIELHQKTKKKLLFFHGDTEKVIKYLIKKLNLESVYVNSDYTPYSIERDSKIQKICKSLKCEFKESDDILLNSLEYPKKDDGTYYMTFTKYADKARMKKPLKPNYLNIESKLLEIKEKLKFNIHLEKLKGFYEFNPNNNVKGGRKQAKLILKNILNQKNYNEKRSLCNYKSTNLSAYIKFGVVSIREVYYTFLNNLGPQNDLVKQLYWREFYYYLLFHFPNTYLKKEGLKSTYKTFPWSYDKNKFNKWCNGETGFPIVDASMKQLNQTGYLPNRSRLIVANFLTKLLRIDWTWGEKYFAQKLVDYSVSNNLGNWQWVASIGADYQNRIYNPMSQSLKSDPYCLYIKKWLPVLKDIPNKDIHNWNKSYEKHTIDYHKPMINYQEEYKLSKSLYKKHA